ncbi:hypothetical protein CKY12_08315 [Photorhabdus sp. S12-55]|uniref:Uncharacterized protein n=1 Tax=Photorhabdus laumondii subsp. clarkei TaxID=2029685 RepID=A0A329VL96_9GAMM|nr:hypothetical protein PluDJC_22395 [Photorhabdus laumondii subsp. laumondii]RAW72711.1 hypothetical protein CKY15_06855 [Photorhabdus sp. S7-51]RAW74490.1 hypothetical protein CKY14_05660 [Photorhabdus sp. S14-60]RAW78948.1 hypothetical protein CKY06_05815 [Photorhabdus sp. S15-56]RAW86214.1 hypothetical protein CKY09_08955 [Photorhabdus sp. S5P8-50]RAW86332.1 hypothetical protein CKY12_08315 [Photorhabdus sp. S12-55]RAW92584.1 hypothetical protein CKY01_03620 [Photorhabdus laumondii subsp.
MPYHPYCIYWASCPESINGAFLQTPFIPVIFQVASLLAVLAHPGHIVIYAPEDSLPYRRDAS